MNDHFISNYIEIPNENYLLVDHIDEYNPEIVNLAFFKNKRESNQIIQEVFYSEKNFINFQKKQDSFSEDESNENKYIKYKIPELFNKRIEKLEEKNEDMDKNSTNKLNENKVEGNIKAKKIKNYKKIKKNKRQKKILIEEDKKNKFISLKLFSPKGETEECQKIREEIGKIISENKLNAISELSEKKPLEKKLFFILNEDYIENPKIKKRRKENPDNIIKKAKHKFLKSIKNKINIKLKIAKSKYLFDFFPYIFTSNINKQKNQIIINKKLIELLTTNFFEEYQNENLIEDKDKYLKEKMKNEKKYFHNLKVVEYLEKNENIRKKINFDYIKEMTFEKMFKEYLESKEFEEDILELKKIEKPQYIKEFIIKAYNFIEYFSE